MRDETKKIKGILARNIKKFRAGLGLTQEQAAEKAELTLKYWQRLEMVSQVDLPSLPALHKIALSLEVKMNDLLVD